MKREPVYFAKSKLWFVLYEERTCVFCKVYSLHYKKLTMKKEPVFFAKSTLWYVHYEEKTCVLWKKYTLMCLLWKKNMCFLQSLHYDLFTMKKEPVYFVKSALWFVHYEERTCVFCKVFTMICSLWRKNLCFLQSLHYDMFTMK